MKESEIGSAREPQSPGLLSALVIVAVTAAAVAVLVLRNRSDAEDAMAEAANGLLAALVVAPAPPADPDWIEALLDAVPGAEGLEVGPSGGPARTFGNGMDPSLRRFERVADGRTYAVAMNPLPFRERANQRLAVGILTILALAIFVVTFLSYLRRGRERRLARRLRDEMRRLQGSGFASSIDGKDLGEIGVLLEHVRRDLSGQRDELARRNEELESIDQVKNRFLANMSHEIRTPLTAILGFTDMIDDESLAPERRRRALDTVRRNGRHLLLIVNDILDLSKIQAGRMTVEQIPVSIRDILKDVEEVMAPRAASKSLGFEVTVEDSVPKLVESDPTRLRQILANLIGNAIKFTTSGEVLVHADAVVDEESDRARVRIRVKDTGIGMSEDAQVHVFEPFMQADSSVTRRFGGTGLGLAISRQLAELLGGTLGCQSRLGEGSEFALEIAGAVCAGSRSGLESGAENPTSSTDPEGLRVLVVEDSRDNQILITLLLKKLGADVTVADDGDAGITRLLEANENGRPFHIVFMDMQMPILDGYEATRRLRDQGVDTPIVALTAHAMAGDRERCLEAGCNEFLSKPINRAALAQIVERFSTTSAS